VAAVPPEYAASIAKWGHLADAEAHKYHLSSGDELVAMVMSGESGFRMNATSSAGAKGGGQFMPGTRAAYIQRYGLDPWRSVDEAVHSVAIYMQKGGGLAGYNPGGGQSYLKYILGQKVSGLHKRGAITVSGNRSTSSADTAGSGGEAVGPEQRSTLVRVLVTILFVFVGLALTVAGLSHGLGLGEKAKPLAEAAAVAAI
jgi:hypothetical protein